MSDELLMKQILDGQAAQTTSIDNLKETTQSGFLAMGEKLATNTAKLDGHINEDNRRFDDIEKGHRVIHTRISDIKKRARPSTRIATGGGLLGGGGLLAFLIDKIWPF